MAARILGWEQVGLGPLLERTLGVVSDKRMQRTDWARRPLTAEQIAYAQMDTHYLFTLQRILTAALHDAGRWDEARAAFAQLVMLDASEYPVIERTFWSMRAAHRAPLHEEIITYRSPSPTLVRYLACKLKLSSPRQMGPST